MDISFYDNVLFTLSFMGKSFDVTILLILGLLGQTIFGARFILQWLKSEKEKKSVIPLSFWYISLLGSMLLLAYSILQKDIVFTLGQSTGFLIYLRNIVLVKKNEEESEIAEVKIKM